MGGLQHCRVRDLDLPGERARREDDEKSPLTVGGRYVFSLRSMIRSTGTRALEEE
jgi:hypothetical protein